MDGWFVRSFAAGILSFFLDFLRLVLPAKNRRPKGKNLRSLGAHRHDKEDSSDEGGKTEWIDASRAVNEADVRPSDVRDL